LDYVKYNSFRSHYKTAKPSTTIASGMFTHHQAMLYRRTSIKDLRYNEAYQIAADYDFTTRFLAQNPHPHYIPTPICIFEPGGISQQKTTQGRREQFQIRKTLNLCSNFENHIITKKQHIATLLRKISPQLYWRVKRS